MEINLIKGKNESYLTHPKLNGGDMFVLDSDIIMGLKRVYLKLFDDSFCLLENGVVYNKDICTNLLCYKINGPINLTYEE